MVNTLKDDMLAITARYGAVTRESLLMERSDKRYTERVIKDCLDNGLIDEHVRRDVVRVDYLQPITTVKLKRVVDGKRIKNKAAEKDEHHYYRTLKYYTISDKGLEYIASRREYSEEEIITIKKLRRLFDRGGRSIDRQLGVSQSELMLWDMTGIDGDVYEVSPWQIKLYDGMGFANAKTVKYVAQNGCSRAEDVLPSHDFDRGRYNGCYISEKKIVAVYNNFTPGMAWSKQIADPEEKVIRLFANAVKKENNISGDTSLHACVLVTNPKHLRQIVNDLPGARRIPSKTKLNVYRLGDPYISMYAVPVSTDGTNHIRKILDGGYEAMENQIRRALWDKGYKTDIGLPGYSMIKIPAGNTEISYTVSLSLDISAMVLMQWYMRTHPATKCGVICNTWQMAYWRAVFGETLSILPAETVL